MKQYLSVLFYFVVGALLYFIFFANYNLYQLRKQELKIGVSTDYYPYVYKDDNGNIVGYEIDLVKKICKKNKLKYKIVEDDFESLIPKLQDEKYDMILGGISKTSEREQFMSFSKSIRYDDVVLVSYKSQLYEGMTLGYQYSSSHFELATNIVDKYHFSSNAMAYVSAKDMINALKSHKVDAILVNSSIAEYQLKNYYITGLGYNENSYIGFNHEDNKLKSFFDKSLG